MQKTVKLTTPHRSKLTACRLSKLTTQKAELMLNKKATNTRLPVNNQHEVTVENTFAAEVIDRVVHDAHRVELSGESLRKSKNRKKL